MKRIISIVLLLALLFALAACGNKDAGSPSASQPDSSSGSPANTPAPEVSPTSAGSQYPWNPDNIRDQSFILAHGMAAENVVSKCYHEFCVMVEEVSEGKMKIEEKIGGTLVTDTETFDALLDGTVDFIHSMGSYVSGVVKDLSPLTIAGYYGGDNWLDFAYGTKDLVGQIYADYGVKYLGALYQGTSVIACSARQIKQPSDVSGLAFRASGEWVSKTVEAWGGAATNIALPQLADAFSKGTVEGVVTGWTIIGGWGIYEVAKYLTTTDICEGFAALLMNGEKWNSLNGDEQALLNYCGEKFMDKNYELTLAEIDNYIARVESEGLNEIYAIPPDINQTFIEIAYSLYPVMEQQSNLLGQKGLDLIKMLRQYNGIS